jgi:hypothetical protein
VINRCEGIAHGLREGEGFQAGVVEQSAAHDSADRSNASGSPRRSSASDAELEGRRARDRDGRPPLPPYPAMGVRSNDHPLQTLEMGGLHATEV